MKPNSSLPIQKYCEVYHLTVITVVFKMMSIMNSYVMENFKFSFVIHRKM
jgi:hypothetical protein